MKMQNVLSLRTLASWTCGVVLGVTAAAASAEQLLERAPKSGGDAGFSATNVSGERWADSFSLGTSASLDGIVWWGSYFNDDDLGDEFHVSLYNDLTGVGTVRKDFGAVPVTKTLAGVLDGFGNRVYRYVYDFGPGATVDLPAGTYGLSVDNFGVSDWLWLEGATGASAARVSVSGGDWMLPMTPPHNLAFSLSGTLTQQIPEPASLALVFLGCAGLGFARRYGKRQQ